MNEAHSQCLKNKNRAIKSTLKHDYGILVAYNTSTNQN